MRSNRQRIEHASNRGGPAPAAGILLAYRQLFVDMADGGNL